MNYINNFRYGEISRRLSGRFDLDAYSNAAFSFRNMKTNSMGFAERRPPIKKLLDATGILALVGFNVSESISYAIGLASEKYHIYRYVTGTFMEVTNGEYPHLEDEDEITLTFDTAHEVYHAQYYTRMYFAHHTFRPFYIDINPSTDRATAVPVTIILNQDARNDFWFTPAYVADSEGRELPNLEKRLVYKQVSGGITRWFFDKEFTEPYEQYVFYPPVQGESSYINNFESFPDDDLLTGPGNWPSVIRCISDSLYMAATDNHPQALWKSRVLGSSQYIEGYVPDSMHDFVCFQSVISEKQEIVDADDMPMTPMLDATGSPVYEQDSGVTMYFIPDKDENGNYLYLHRVYWIPDDVNTDQGKWYIDSEGKTEYDMSQGQPVPKPIMIYDLSDADKFMRTAVTVDFTSTDACALSRIEFNTSQQNRIMFIEPACERIIIGTTNAEHSLPTDFSAVNNLSAKNNFYHYGSVASYMVKPANLNASFIFMQRSNIMRELYLNEGYMANADVTAFNHDIFKGKTIVELTVKNTPDPMVYVTLSDGTMKVLTYDKTNNVQSFASWDTPAGKILSTADLERNNGNDLLVLVSNDDGTWIGYFDEEEEKSFKDNGYNYISEIETTYVEVIDSNRLGFSTFKKVNSAYIRCYNTGKVITADDRRQYVTSPYELGDEDYPITYLSTAGRKYSLVVRAYEDDPMTILCFGYEVA